MKILAICSSPKSENSTTLKIVQPLLTGMADAGANYEIVDLAKLRINHCLGCMSCWLRTPGTCAIKDDMAHVLTKFIAADFIIFATPLYVYTMSGLMKNFLDRMMPLALPFIEEASNAKGTCTHHGRFPNVHQKMLLVSSCGFPELSHFSSLLNYFECMSGQDKCDFDYVGAILRPAASLLGHEMYKTQTKNYYENLQIAGKELVMTGKIPAELNNKLHELWIDAATFRKIANQHFSETIKKNK